MSSLNRRIVNINFFFLTRLYKNNNGYFWHFILVAKNNLCRVVSAVINMPFDEQPKRCFCNRPYDVPTITEEYFIDGRQYEYTVPLKGKWFAKL